MSSSHQPAISLSQLPQVQSTIHTTPTVEEVEKKPWKYIGYHIFTQWAASDDDFFVVRRFGALNTRVILKWQDDITRLEEELETLEKENSRVGGPAVNNGSFRHDAVPRRRQILMECYTKLKEYNDFIASYSTLRSRPPANPHEITNVKNWFYRYPAAILDSEAEYVNHTDDLMSIVPKIKTPLRSVLENIRGFRLSSIFRIKPTTAPEIYDPETTHYHSDTRMELFVTIVIVSIGLLMLIAPLWVLMFVGNQIKRLAIITAFIIVFLLLISTVTVAKPFESLAATAAYSAVLMVFMQMQGGKS
ncbi:MAG: hypothetical protein M1813_008994 [Trichoglossum hirsutum]|nr:MAG: hypothetical protein M1813_008994 [Trichoglossum hirsutum]